MTQNAGAADHAAVLEGPAQLPALPDIVERELTQLRSIVGLLTFAVEARRVLREVDSITSIDPAVRKSLSCIEARCQWGEYPDEAATVLDSVYARLGALLGD
jgi:hypothetical protein